MSQHYAKHLIECKCILKIFEDVSPMVFHKFVVFSEFDNDGNLIPSYTQCNNCGVIHKVTEVATSILLGKEDMKSLQTIEDIELELPPQVVRQLKTNDCDLHVWQEARHILNHKLWGKFVVLSRERQEKTLPGEPEKVVGKALVILGDSLFKVETFEQTDEVVS